MKTMVKDFFYDNKNTGERKHHNVVVLKERDFASQKVMQSTEEDSIEGIDLSLLSEKKVKHFLKVKEAYDKQMAKVMPMAYRKFLKSGIIEVDQILGK